MQAVNMLIGYARVSTRGQNLEAQILELEKAGCKKVFQGKFSGAGCKNQDMLSELIDYVRDNDTVVATRLDRFGRSLKGILSAIDDIHAKGANLKTLDGALDTSNDSPMSKAIVSLLGLFAQLERDLILDRTSEGRERAKTEGKHMGRPSKLTEDIQNKIKNKYSKGISKSALSREYGVSRPTISRITTDGGKNV